MGHARANPKDSFELGLEHARAGHSIEAIACFEKALARAPNDVRVLFALGNTAQTIGHKDAAETFYRRVLAQEPDRLEALVNLSNLLRARGRTGETIALLKPALERHPEQSELWLTLGSSLREAGDIKTAEIFYREALRLSPDCAPALGNLGDLLSDAGDSDAALALYERVLQLEPQNAQAHLNRAILYFIKGDLASGWRDYEYRLRIKSRVIVADHGLKRWKGLPAPGVKLLVTAEQGIGDQIMFASLIPELSETLTAAGGTLLLEAEPRLVPLFARSFPNVSVQGSNIEDRGGKKLAHYPWLKPHHARAAIALGSLPQFLRNDLAAFPSRHAYLKADSQEQIRWREWLKPHGPAIGICWRSGLTGGLRNLQYAPLQSWAAFLRELPATPVSLQYDAQAGEIAELSRESGRTILVPPFDQKREIDRAAALIACLDGVVSAPTAVAWIAGASGVPTTKVLYNGSWTAFGTDHEPFAPAIRNVSPRTAGDWTECFAKVSLPWRR